MGKTIDMLIAGLGALLIAHGTYNLGVFDRYEIKINPSVSKEQIEKHLDLLPAVAEFWSGVFVLAYSLTQLRRRY